MKLSNKTLKSRSIFILVCIFLVFIIVLFKCFYIQIINRDSYVSLAKSNSNITLSYKAVRGSIYSESGIPLAIDNKYYGIFIIPARAKNLSKLISQVKGVIPLTQQEINKFYIEVNKTSRYRKILLENITPSEYNLLQKDFKTNKAIALGFGYTRSYPYKEVTGNILGYLSFLKTPKNGYIKNQLIGVTGLEESYESILKGVNGKLDILVNNLRYPIKYRVTRNSISGDNLYLSLNIKLQKYIYSLLGNTVGSVLVIDPSNGNILAAVSYPGYDNNKFVGGISYNDYNSLINSSSNVLYSKFSQAQYPASNALNPFVLGYIYMELNSDKASISSQDILDYLNSFGFNSSSNFATGASSGSILQSSLNSLALNYNNQNGFNFINFDNSPNKITTLQLAQAMEAVVNNGFYYRAHYLVSYGKGSNLKAYQSKVINTIKLSKASWSYIKASFNVNPLYSNDLGGAIITGILSKKTITSNNVFFVGYMPSYKKKYIIAISENTSGDQVVNLSYKIANYIQENNV